MARRPAAGIIERLTVLALIQRLVAPDFYRRSRLFEFAAKVGHVVGERRRQHLEQQHRS